MKSRYASLLCTLAVLFAVPACDDSSEPTTPVTTPDAAAEVATPDAVSETSTPLPDDLEMTAGDFECLTNWTRVRRFYITNKAGRLAETLEVANDPEGKTYPVGTIIQLVPFEAMVKRKAGWAPESNDWEFFFLDNSSGVTVIQDRGTAGVENQFGGECLPCHAKAANGWDMVCEQDHGCDPLGITDFIIDSFVDGDERCQ